MVQGHVQGVVDEVAYGEGDEGVAGGREGGDQVVLHLRGLGVPDCTPGWWVAGGGI